VVEAMVAVGVVGSLEFVEVLATGVALVVGAGGGDVAAGVVDAGGVLVVVVLDLLLPGALPAKGSVYC
jgi:hypothetical protein